MSESAKLQIVSEAKPLPKANSVSSVIEIGGEKIDLIRLRDFLLSLRDRVYCPHCACPDWDAYSRNDRLLHYSDCVLGKYVETLLRVFPKEKTSIKWMPE